MCWGENLAMAEFPNNVLAKVHFATLRESISFVGNIEAQQSLEEFVGA